MEPQQDCLKLYEVVCFDDTPLPPHCCRPKDWVFIVRAISHESAVRLAEKTLPRTAADEGIVCRSVRHIGYDLHAEESAAERVMHRCRKTLAVNLGYPEWTRSSPDSPWVFIGPEVEPGPVPLIESSEGLHDGDSLPPVYETKGV